MYRSFDHLRGTGEERRYQAGGDHRYDGHEGTDAEVRPRADLEGLTYTSDGSSTVVVPHDRLHPLSDPQHEHEAHQSSAIDDPVGPDSSVGHQGVLRIAS